MDAAIYAPSCMALKLLGRVGLRSLLLSLVIQWSCKLHDPFSTRKDTWLCAGNACIVHSAKCPGSLWVANGLFTRSGLRYEDVWGCMTYRSYRILGLSRWRWAALTTRLWGREQTGQGNAQSRQSRTTFIKTPWSRALPMHGPEQGSFWRKPGKKRFRKSCPAPGSESRMLLFELETET